MRGIMLAAAVVPAVTAAPIAGHWQMHADQHHITVTPRPQRCCATCHGASGVWISGRFPEMEACGCWSDRRHLRIPLRRGPAADPLPEEPPF
ncbi:hypothetical protein ACFWC5_23510 [Streptomyces sp. NPDC060085]|uniref:hypothetical protein n=1 Tax=Streptomyces sp. NPDC060085 TaxID=3347054 RepID=UPI0036572B2D